MTTEAKNKADEAAIAEGCYFDRDAGLKVVNFFEKFLRHSKGEWAGKPFVLQDWQRDEVIMPLFGWKKADGSRRFRQAYIEIPKKNGKSAMLSGINLYMLVGDGEAGAEVYSAAADRDQASIIFNESVNMVQASPQLSKRLEIVASQKRIVFIAQRSFYRALSAEVATKEGFNIHCLSFDELHAQRTRDLWDTLRYGGAARRQPLTIAITTAGYDRHSICYEQRDYAVKVRDSIIPDPSFFAYVRAADEKDDWKDRATWYKANPSLGVTITEDSFKADLREAVESPVKENTFKRYRLNIWTEQDTRWLQMERWDQCIGDISPDDLEGRECFAGLDLASTTDIAAFVMRFNVDGKIALLPTFWIPLDNAKRRSDRDHVPYLQWIKDGLIRTTPGDVLDYDVIRRDINELSHRFKIVEIAADRWNATQIITQLTGDGFTIFPFGQGFASMSAPTKELEKLVIGKSLVHFGNPVMRWMASNSTVEQDAAGNIKPSKQKSTEKIDGIVASIMAIARGMVHTQSKPSVYETRGVLQV